MKFLKVSALSLVLLMPVAGFAVELPVEVKPCTVCEKVGNFVNSVKAKLPSMPAMPSKEEATAMVKNAPKAMKEFAQAHPYKTTAIIAATAAVAYAVYKVCTAKKAKTTKVVVVK
ncbi:MAG: hypothetical protein AMXMBFR12_07090 [Candidatus Babeliales bacterium]